VVLDDPQVLVVASANRIPATIEPRGSAASGRPPQSHHSAAPEWERQGEHHDHQDHRGEICRTFTSSVARESSLPSTRHRS